MQHEAGGYSMQQITPYRDNPGASSNPNLQDLYSGAPHSPSGIHAHSPFDSVNDVSDPARSSLAQTPLAASSSPYMSAPLRNYENLDEAVPNSQWLEEKARKSNRRSKWVVIGSLITILVLVAVGVALGVTLGKKKSSSGSNNSSSSTPPGTNTADPSNFQKNPALKQSFYGIAYTPAGSQLPDCGNTLDQVIEDIQLLSQLTTNIRLYGADCNQSSLVLAAIQLTKVNMNVYLGNYPAINDNGVAYQRQKGEIQTAIQNYGVNNVAGITVGNEFILDYVTDQGQSDPNGSAGDAAAQQLIPYIQDTRTMIQSMNLGKTIPVGNADAGSYFNTQVLEAVDYGMSNVHPWFANQTIDNAAGWTAEFFATTNVAAAQALSNQPKMYIAETGWPTDTSQFNYSPNDGPSLASVPNLQIFLDTFVCQANQNGTGYFFFEYFDETWKATTYGGVEGYWGLFDSNRNLKNLTIPDCAV
ncbi:glycoside hydrolase family 17 protein [Leucogyrophana mollusca]|uniref:Glycoside hydrolase family 17 protein n=1 Tax=Leucogyrophana mollusca TaxID=85980 RepID=A0ACB8BMJ4_9AGAM|nr:glycoside hydrolase family 17 protein [Leucogyrophana mollusca]